MPEPESQQPEEKQQEGASAEPEQATDSGANAEISPDSELAEALREKDQFKRLAQRAQADLVNYRRRIESEQESSRLRNQQRIVLRFADVIDQLEKALQSDTLQDADSNWLEGLTAIQKNFMNAIAAEGFRPEHELARHLGVPAGEILRIARDGLRLDRALIARAIRNQRNAASRTAVARYAGRGFDQAVAHMCSEMRPNQALPAATISFVSLMPAIFMVADLIKRRLYGWRLPKGQPNVLQCDALRLPDQRTICNVLAGRGCLCQSDRYSRAFQQRQRLRNKYLGVRFSSPAVPGPPGHAGCA